MGSGVKEEAFDPGTPPPPFGLAEIWAAIPKHCWVKGPRQSMSYVVVIFGLAVAAAYLNNWIMLPFYWMAPCSGLSSFSGMIGGLHPGICSAASTPARARKSKVVFE
ncbi:hypothetical protein OPV22_001954 [Ensete ventricosum]|uniref:Fatty acid desaturase N-terminal domain-containing protein n=1 Tax=Ensete ventricosum TaxID=4639 RepID=A0AAV8QF51_ENSVE|nr:hypothetical protein OPV22_001954 [Ensete ventricosum]